MSGPGSIPRNLKLHNPARYLGCFTSIHIPSKQTFNRSMDFIDRRHFLAVLNKWNRLGGNDWKYYEQHDHHGSSIIIEGICNEHAE